MIDKKIVCCDVMKELDPWHDYLILDQDDLPRENNYYVLDITELGFYFYESSESEIVLSNKPVKFCPWCGVKI